MIIAPKQHRHDFQVNVLDTIRIHNPNSNDNKCIIKYSLLNSVPTNIYWNKSVGDSQIHWPKIVTIDPIMVTGANNLANLRFLSKIVIIGKAKDIKGHKSNSNNLEKNTSLTYGLVLSLNSLNWMASKIYLAIKKYKKQKIAKINNIKKYFLSSLTNHRFDMIIANAGIKVMNNNINPALVIIYPSVK